MKPVILIGASRAGKSTFSKMLFKKYKNVQIISGDMIRISYEKWKKEEVKGNKEFNNFLLDIFNNSIKYFDDYIYVLDAADIEISDLKNIKKEDYNIFVFGYPDIEVENLLDIWNKIDTKWITNKTQKELKEKALRNIGKSKSIQKECIENNIKFINTSKDRLKVLKKLLKECE